MPCWWEPIGAKQLSMSASAQLIWFSVCMRCGSGSVYVCHCLFYKIIISVNPNSVLTVYVYVSDQTVSYSSMTFGALGWLPGGNIYSPHSLHGEALPERGTVRKLLRCRYDHFLAQKVWVLLWALLVLTSCKQWYFFILIVSYSYGY